MTPTRTTPTRTTPTAADPILLELLRSRLQAVVDEGALAIEQTAVSPIVAEGKDFACNLLGPRGELLAGGGKVEYKWAGARNVVATTLERHGGTIVAGDVFAANDPHHGGGNHPQDIEICRPVFVGDELIAWVAASAHLIDVGGMTFGSWAPDATECYQEAIRFPPVRLFAGGVEQSDTWALILNNVRLASLVEMDIRGLVAGCHVSAAKLASVAESLGVAEFLATVAAMCDNSERVLRERIGRLADGEYATDGWVEWGDEQYHLPCRLVVRGDQLCFDFTGAPPQVPHFINSKAYLVKGEIVADVRSNLAQDLPFTEGMYRPIEVVCPPGTIVESAPPAPIASAHLEVAMNATGLAVQCLQLALAAHRRRLVAAAVRGAVGAGRGRRTTRGPTSRPTAASTAGSSARASSRARRAAWATTAATCSPTSSARNTCSTSSTSRSPRPGTRCRCSRSGPRRARTVPAVTAPDRDAGCRTASRVTSVSTARCSRCARRCP